MPTKDQLKSYQKEYYQLNKDQLKAYQKEYRETNKIKMKKYKKEYRKNNKDQIKQYNKEYKKEYYQLNKNKIKQHQLKRKYNISLEHYNQMLIEQNHKCKICNIDEVKLTKKLAVDHDHKTGFIRGLLCHSCNVAIGLLQESAEIIEKAAKYINGDK